LTVANSSALNFDVTPSFALVVKVQDNGTGTLSSQATAKFSMIYAKECLIISNQDSSLNTNTYNGTSVESIEVSCFMQAQTIILVILLWEISEVHLC
jgi:hypothetical protein